MCRTRCYKVEIHCRNICVKSENQSTVDRLTLELREPLTVVKRWIVTTTFMPRIRLFLSRIYTLPLIQAYTTRSRLKSPQATGNTILCLLALNISLYIFGFSATVQIPLRAHNYFIFPFVIQLPPGLSICLGSALGGPDLWCTKQNYKTVKFVWSPNR